MSKTFAPGRLDVAAFAQAKASLSAHDSIQKYERLAQELRAPEADLTIDWQADGEQRSAVDGSRRPALHRIYGLDNQAGLSNILIGAGRLEQYVHRSDQGNLDVLVGGPTPPNPAEQLASPMMRQFLDEAVRRYDHVVLDAPPALLASDAAALGTMVDGTVLVLRAKANSRGVAQRALNLLHHVSAHVFGVVLNAAQAQRGGYFREQLRTFYDYHAEEAEEPGARRALPTAETASSKGRRTREDDKRDGDAPSA